MGVLVPLQWTPHGCVGWQVLCLVGWQSGCSQSAEQAKAGAALQSVQRETHCASFMEMFIEAREPAFDSQLVAKTTLYTAASKQGVHFQYGGSRQDTSMSNDPQDD